MLDFFLVVALVTNVGETTFSDDTGNDNYDNSNDDDNYDNDSSDDNNNNSNKVAAVILRIIIRHKTFMKIIVSINHDKGGKINSEDDNENENRYNDNANNNSKDQRS